MTCNDFHADTLCHTATLTFDPLTLKFAALRVSRVQTVYKIWAKSHNPRPSYWPFSTFSPSNFRGWDTFFGRFSGVRRPNVTKLGEDIGRSSTLTEFVSEFRYLAAFSNAGGSNASDVKNKAKFWTFAPPHYKNRREAGEVDQLMKLY